MTKRRRRLIEVAFPLKEVSTHSRREKNVRQGHISTLHIWWARRPLAACRTFVYASLVDDPETDAERDELLKEVADLASWDAVRHPDRVIRTVDEGGSGLTGAELIERARKRILDSNAGEAPGLFDPFAGGGAIPLEGLRLGCEVEASDLNPVAVLILKGTLEYPQKYGQPNSREVPQYILDADADNSQRGFAAGEWGTAYLQNPLATDVRFWGTWMLERAREELAEFYPPDPDGSVPLAYLWSRTVPCPSCDSEMPLIRQFWLARRPNRRVALEPLVDRKKSVVDFRVASNDDVTGSPEHATTSRGDSRCLICGQILKGADIRLLSVNGKLSARMTAVALGDGKGYGKGYRTAGSADMQAFEAADAHLQQLKQSHSGEHPLIPDEPIDPKTLGLRIDGFGFDEWGKLFNPRQLLALTTLVRLTEDTHTAMLKVGMDAEYGRAVASYLGIAVNRQATRSSTGSFWDAGGETVQQIFARQALPLVYDFVEGSPLQDSSGGFSVNLDTVVAAIQQQSFISSVPVVVKRDARQQSSRKWDHVVTDPPYYNAIDYAGLSDFFYVWSKRTVGSLHPGLFDLPLTPKAQQVIMASENRDPKQRARYIEMMGEAFDSMASVLKPHGLLGVVFAHTDPDAWATLIDGLLSVGLVPESSWPIDTEAQSGIKVVGQARLKTSVWMACRKREEGPTEAFLGDVLEEMRPVIRERLLYFWSQGIRGADFFISAIGPALSVFGRHLRVLNPDGSEVSVRDFLDIVRRESTAVALEQVLQGADLGMVDALTRQYVTWVWSYSRASLDAGEALALCLATGTRLDDVTRDHSIAVTAKQRSKKVVKLRKIAERAREDDDLGGESSARSAPLIDQLQCAAWLWGQNQSDRLGRYRAALSESRWSALLTLGQAVASCLPEGDEDRRIILGLLGATVRATETPAPSPQLSLGMDEGDGTE